MLRKSRVRLFDTIKAHDVSSFVKLSKRPESSPDGPRRHCVNNTLYDPQFLRAFPVHCYHCAQLRRWRVLRSFARREMCVSRGYTLRIVKILYRGIASRAECAFGCRAFREAVPPLSSGSANRIS